MPPASLYTQANRPLKVFTKLPDDALLAVDLEGHEAISEPFRFRLDLLAKKGTPIPFDQMIGETAHVELKFAESTRYFHGIITEFSEGSRDENFTHYRAVLAPAVWRLTKHFRFRIFQEKSVVDILKTVLAGYDVRFQTVGTYRARNYTVQYFETDFAFASRLMEQEGIFYYFVHRADGHTLMVADGSMLQPEIAAPSKIRFAPLTAEDSTPLHEPRVTGWRKTQELCSGKFTYWDYSFQIPENHLEASSAIHDSVPAGEVVHRLTVGANKDLEVYRFTGEYGWLQDGIDPSGSERASVLQGLFEESQKFALLEMEREACQSLRVDGASTCCHFLPGLHFELSGHDNADGAYLLTRTAHRVRQSGYRSGEEEGFEYRNDFLATPKELPFRPARGTPWPRAQGLQPAVVVGPAGEEIFTDKFGRVKVQFLWDREGKHNADSSCWIRVAHAHAGKGFGSVSLPRVGEEVLIGFAGDNPDSPMIVGRLYNARNGTPFELPKHRTRSAQKSQSLRGSSQQFSGLTIEDQQGNEKVQLHAEKDMVFSAENDKTETVGANHQEEIGGSHKLTIGGDRLQRVSGSQVMVVGGPGNLGEESIQADDFIWSGSSDGSGTGGGSEATISGSVGSNVSVSFGFSSALVGGVAINHNVGPSINVCVDPLGMLGGAGEEASLAASWAGGFAAAFGGTYSLTLGSTTSIMVGPVFNRLACKDEQKDFYTGGLVDPLHPIEKALVAAYGLLSVGTVIGMGAYAHDQPNSFANSKAAEVLFSLNLSLLTIFAIIEGVLLKWAQLRSIQKAGDGNASTGFPAIFPFISK